MRSKPGFRRVWGGKSAAQLVKGACSDQGWRQVAYEHACSQPHPPEVTLCPGRLKLDHRVSVCQRLREHVKTSVCTCAVAVQDVQELVSVSLAGAGIDAASENLYGLLELA